MTLVVQAQAARRHAAAEAAADARTVLRKEAEWMSRQPKARQVSALHLHDPDLGLAVLPSVW